MNKNQMLTSLDYMQSYICFIILARYLPIIHIAPIHSFILYFINNLLLDTKIPLKYNFLSFCVHINPAQGHNVENFLLSNISNMIIFLFLRKFFLKFEIPYPYLHN